MSLYTNVVLPGYTPLVTVFMGPCSRTKQKTKVCAIMGNTVSHLLFRKTHLLG